MRFPDAKKLHREDEVKIRLGYNSGSIHKVVEVEVDSANHSVFVRCEDGVVYHHKEIM